MTRHAFKMNVAPQHAAEYQRRHDEIWPELLRAHEEVGITDYSIFLDEETGTLFATMKLKDHHQLATLGEKDIVKKWWAYNKDIMDYEGERPSVCPLREVFHMD